jgi:hypothetical protein
MVGFIARTLHFAPGVRVIEEVITAKDPGKRVEKAIAACHPDEEWRAEVEDLVICFRDERLAAKSPVKRVRVTRETFWAVAPFVRVPLSHCA